MKQEQRKYILENAGKKSVKEIAAELGLKERKIKKILEKRDIDPKRVTVPEAEKNEARPFNKKTILISAILIIAAGLIVYANSLNGKFLYDDDVLVKGNAYLKSWSNVPKFFTEDVGRGAGMKYTFYRPLQMITYMMDYSVWGFNSAGYHLTNMLLHILATLTVFWLINLLFGDERLGLLTGLFFAVHPIHTEAVSYISGRPDPLALTFMLISFIFYVKRCRGSGMAAYFLMLISYALALLARESSLILPVLLVLYHYTFKEKLKLSDMIPVCAITAAYIVLRLTVLKFIISHIVQPTTLVQRIPGFFVAITKYFQLLVLPLNLHMEYVRRIFSFLDPRSIIGLAILSFSLFYAFKKREDRITSFSILWFFAALAPVSNIYPINTYMAEHWLYLPSIGFFLIISNSLISLYEKKSFRVFAILIAAGLISFYSYMTIMQNGYWREPIPFYERTVRYAPDSWRAYTNLGNAYKDTGKNADAIEAYKRAIEANPAFAEAYNNLGNAYLEAKKVNKAIDAYKAAIEANPNYMGSYINLANVYNETGKFEEAVELYKKFIAAATGYAAAYYGLGNAYRGAGKNNEAIEQYNKAIALDPNMVAAYNNLGNVYYAAGKKDEAVSAYKKAAQLAPDYADSYNNLGVIYANMGNQDEAMKYYKKAVEVDSKYGTGYGNLAVLYYFRKEYDTAINYCDKAAKLGYSANPEFLKALEPYRKN